MKKLNEKAKLTKEDKDPTSEKTTSYIRNRMMSNGL